MDDQGNIPRAPKTAASCPQISHCNYCERSYKLPSSLTKHMRERHPENCQQKQRVRHVNEATAILPSFQSAANVPAAVFHAANGPIFFPFINARAGQNWPNLLSTIQSAPNGQPAAFLPAIQPAVSANGPAVNAPPRIPAFLIAPTASQLCVDESPTAVQQVANGPTPVFHAANAPSFLSFTNVTSGQNWANAPPPVQSAPNGSTPPAGVLHAANCRHYMKEAADGPGPSTVLHASNVPTVQSMAANWLLAHRRANVTANSQAAKLPAANGLAFQRGGINEPTAQIGANDAVAQPTNDWPTNHLDAMPTLQPLPQPVMDGNFRQNLKQERPASMNAFDGTMLLDNTPSTSTTSNWGQIEQQDEQFQQIVEEEDAEVQTIEIEKEMEMKPFRPLASLNALQIARGHMMEACSTGHHLNFVFDKRGRIESMTAEFRCQSCISNKQIQVLKRCRYDDWVICRACCPHRECKTQYQQQD